MSLDQQAALAALQPRVPLESVLGSAEGRYFGAGYRAVSYVLTTTARDTGTLTGVGQVTYPQTWSTDASGQSRPPHLSSIDATLLPLMLLEELTPPEAQEALSRTHITALHLVAGSTPFLNLEAVPIQGKLEETETGARLRATVGNIKVTLTLEKRPAGIGLPRHAGAADAPSVYSHLFRTIESTSWIRRDEQDVTRLTGEHVLQLSPTAGAAEPRGGLEGLQWPAPTIVDYLVVMGQLTQALVYTAAGRRRTDSGPLWMRSIDITLDGSPCALPAHFTTSIELLRDRTITRNGTILHDCKVRSSASTGVSAVATLAYQEAEDAEALRRPGINATAAESCTLLSTRATQLTDSDQQGTTSGPAPVDRPGVVSAGLEASRGRVLQIAARLLSRVPLRDVCLQDVADDAGLPIVDLQRLHGSIHDLGAAILDHERSVMTAIQHRVREVGGSALEQVVLAFRLVGEGLERDVVMRAGVRLAQESRHAFPERRLQPTRTWDGFLEALLRQAHAEGQLRADVNVPAEVRRALQEALQVRDELIARQNWSGAADLMHQVGRRRLAAIVQHRLSTTDPAEGGRQG